MTLAQGEEGKTYLVEKLSLAQKTEKRLRALGMTCGTKIEVMKNIFLRG